MLARPLMLPCGIIIPNRLATAMTEGFADPLGLPASALSRLYCVWGDGGLRLLISQHHGR